MEDFFSEFSDDDEFDEGDLDDEVSDKCLIIQRHVKEPVDVTIEAQIGSESTFISIKRNTLATINKPLQAHMFVDTLDPEPILNALESKFEQGGYHVIMNFLKGEGNTIRDPIELRLKLDTMFSVSSIPSVQTNEELVF